MNKWQAQYMTYNSIVDNSVYYSQMRQSGIQNQGESNNQVHHLGARVQIPQPQMGEFYRNSQQAPGGMNLPQNPYVPLSPVIQPQRINSMAPPPQNQRNGYRPLAQIPKSQRQMGRFLADRLLQSVRRGDVQLEAQEEQGCRCLRPCRCLKCCLRCGICCCCCGCPTICSEFCDHLLKKI